MAGKGDERRREWRKTKSIRFDPLSCSLIYENQTIPLKIINFHFRGACFKLPFISEAPLSNGARLKFSIGRRELLATVPFRLVWERIGLDRCFGVEFTKESSGELIRAHRFIAHSIAAPTVVASDPLDPNRRIYFKLRDLSKTGMRLDTSLSNRHMFPGMFLKRAIIEFPNSKKLEVDLTIENARPSEDGKSVHYGASIKSVTDDYLKAVAEYLSRLGQSEDDDPFGHVDNLSNENLLSKNLYEHVTISEIQTESQYQEVLKLRFQGYKQAGKVTEDKTWKSMGEGLSNEGILIGAYLGRQLVGSAEFRIRKLHGLRTEKTFNLSEVKELTRDHLGEINRLVVLPSAQRTDVVLALIQKIHVIAMMNGQPDGVILAEGALRPLYRRLGFKDVRKRIPHPVKPNTELHLMVLLRQTYADAAGINPYAWSSAYETICKYLDEIGLHKYSPPGLIHRLRKSLTRAIFNLKVTKQLRDYFKRRRRTVGSNKATNVQSNQHIKRGSNRNLSDPKWTIPHLAATVMYPYILEAQNMIGVNAVDNILSGLGFDIPYFRSESNWVSIEFFDEFVRQFAKFGDTKQLNIRAAHKALSTEVLGANYYLMKHFLSPNAAFRAVEKVLPKFNKTRVFKVIDSGRNFSHIQIFNNDPSLLPKDPNTKFQWTALIDAYVTTLTGQSADIQVIKSSFDGDPYCEYLIKWQNKAFSRRNLTFASLSFLIFGVASYISYRSDCLFELAVGGASFAAVYGIIRIYRLVAFYKMKYEDIKDGMAKFEKAANDRYQELQESKSILEKSYREGKIIEMISRELQVTSDTTAILDTALLSLCTRFEIRRAFIMLLDNEKRVLKTASAYGGDAPVQDIWDFRVDVSTRRENPMVLSSVFHTGQSILVPNVEEHKFQLNEASKRLIDGLKSNGFAIVPVPSRDGNWGVLVADKGPVGNLITLRDLVVLQRVAQIMGLALDKRAAIDTEKRLRYIFEKYVPGPVLASATGAVEPHLSGQNKEVICCFVDIRNFTNMSHHLAPPVLYDLLNRFFAVLESVVYDFGGVIDKFIGDGALVTWGAIPGSSCDANRAIEAAVALLGKVAEISDQLTFKGLPSLNIGIGLHRGTALAGNIGSHRRMEFTVVGSTVNLASRLEGLSKSLECHIVVSENMIDFSLLGLGWKIHEKVEVRGLAKPIRVATYRSDESTKMQKEDSA